MKMDCNRMKVKMEQSICDDIAIFILMLVLSLSRCYMPCFKGKKIWNQKEYSHLENLRLKYFNDYFNY